MGHMRFSSSAQACSLGAFFRLDMQEAGITYAPLVWSTWGRPHEDSAAAVRSMARSAGRRPGSNMAGLTTRVAFERLSSQICKRAAQMAMACCPPADGDPPSEGWPGQLQPPSASTRIAMIFRAWQKRNVSLVQRQLDKSQKATVIHTSALATGTGTTLRAASTAPANPTPAPIRRRLSRLCFCFLTACEIAFDLVAGPGTRQGVEISHASCQQAEGCTYSSMRLAAAAAALGGWHPAPPQQPPPSEPPHARPAHSALGGMFVAGVPQAMGAVRE